MHKWYGLNSYPLALLRIVCMYALRGCEVVDGLSGGDPPTCIIINYKYMLLWNDRVEHRLLIPVILSRNYLISWPGVQVGEAGEIQLYSICDVVLLKFI